MATYKVPQDVEAEDHLLGPLTLRQFIYGIVVVICGWLTFVLAQNVVTLILLPITIIPFCFFGYLIFLGIKNRTQPAENYLAAQIRFYFKPHKRIWSQDGVMEMVHITVPPKDEHQYTNNLSRYEVKSRLNNLANLMDSHGWAAKDVRYQPVVVTPQSSYEDDRLMDLSQLTQTLEPVEVREADDIMDNTSNPVAQHFDTMIQENQEKVLNEALKLMKSPNYDPYPQMRQQVIQPLSDEPVVTTQPQIAVSYEVSQPQPAPAPQPPVASTPQPEAPPSPAIAELAYNDELSVQTIANQADRLKSLESGEEISLH